MLFRVKDRIIEYLGRIVLPGFDGMPFLQVIKFFYQGMLNGSITTRASAISFSLFLALFPAVIFLFTLIPFIPIDNFQPILLNLLSELSPHKAWPAIENTLTDIVTRPRGGLMSLGFLLAFFFSTNGINSMMDAFNASYHSVESRGLFMQRWVATVLVFILFLLLVMAIVTMAIWSWMYGWLEAGNYAIVEYLPNETIPWIVLVALTYFGISCIYYWGPAKKNPFRFFSAGSSLATIMLMLSNIGFNYYANNMAQYNALYGSIGTLLLVLLWIYFNAIILLIGFELNASILMAKRERPAE